MTTELNHCPFCGGHAELSKDADFYVARCTNCLAETYSTKLSVAKHRWNRRSDADRIAQLERDNACLISAGEHLDRALEEVQSFSDYSTSHDSDDEKWISMHASHWVALLSDARDARAVWSDVGQTQNDHETLRDRVALEMMVSQAGRENALITMKNPATWATYCGLAETAIRVMRGGE